ncbi:unnamed protein product [Meloidogyne enterolobii]|uniref:Uncharacterized protein n=1 Tax=Meloidogyne enterolobii TaxID=390850 RepID=A0ACB0Y6C1_MELEN
MHYMLVQRNHQTSLSNIMHYLVVHHNHQLRNMVVHCATLDQHTSQADVRCSTPATDEKLVCLNKDGASTVCTMVTCSIDVVLLINAGDVEADTTSCCVYNVNLRSVCTTQVTTMDRLKPIGDNLNLKSVCSTRLVFTNECSRNIAEFLHQCNLK